MTTVVNIKVTDKYDVYIGRGSKWGNPYTHLMYGTKAKFVVSTREKAVWNYLDYLFDSFHLMNCLDELKDKILGCYCHPKFCHGHILSHLLNINLMDDKIKVKIEEIVTRYRNTAKDKDKFDTSLVGLRAAIESKGYTHYDVAIASHTITIESGCDRGIYKDLLMLKTDELSSDDVSKIGRHTRSKKMKLTLAQYEERKNDLIPMIECYAPIDQFYNRSRSWREGEIMKVMLGKNAPFTMKDIEKLIETDPENYRIHNSFQEYVNGDYVKYGWMITSDEVENEVVYRLIPINWDGVNVPEGKVAFKDFDDK